MITLAHFSDPHIGPLPNPRWVDLLSKRITGYLNYRTHRTKNFRTKVLDQLIDDLKAQRPDHIALTGDLVNIALDEEIERAGHWLRTIAPNHQLSLIPGNHDAYVAGALAKAKNAWAPFWTADNETTVTFPYLHRRGPLALIGLSTAVATPPFFATGRLGAEQIRQTTQLLHKTGAEGCFRVVLIHHPPFLEKGRWMKRLTDLEAFEKMIASCGAELILHGHNHKRGLTTLKGPTSPVSVVGVPAASSGPLGHNEPARYNLFQIEKQSEGWHCTLTERGLQPDGIFGQLDQKKLKIFST